VDGTPLFHLPAGVETRWASPENRDALRGAGGQAGHGRKGSAWYPVPAGETLVLAHAQGTGTIRRIWITVSDRSAAMLRGLVLRAYWDGEERPAIDVPLGDFFCLSLGEMTAFENAWFDTAEGRSFNCRLPMPFRRGFRLTLTNESGMALRALYYDVDFTLGDAHGEETGYLHACWRREQRTRMREDFTILPRVEGRGRFLGCAIGVIVDSNLYGRTWWGEGEVKVFLDGDGEYPTLCGTGTEDYIGTGYTQGQYAGLWHGCPLADHERMRYAFYRLHGPDPVYFQREARVMIQQIGAGRTSSLRERMRQTGIEHFTLTRGGGELLRSEELEAQTDETFYLFEREDDWCATAYFYLNRPANTLLPLASYDERVAGLI
jgi:Protein of unknown function (DUF2961)